MFGGNSSKKRSNKLNLASEEGEENIMGSDFGEHHGSCVCDAMYALSELQSVKVLFLFFSPFELKRLFIFSVIN